jgi:electron transfer flavoprotein beta subunit
MTVEPPAPPAIPHVIAACVKWTAQVPDTDSADVRFAGVSHADQAALESALLLGDRLGATILAVAVGPPAAEHALRESIACGATSAVRVDASHELASADVAREIAAVVRGASIVVCGDYSADRGSGSVPAYLAHLLRVPQALGLVELSADGDALHAVRRLDGGRREVLLVPRPCVVSVEGSVATLRRAALRATLASTTAQIDVRRRVTSGAAAAPTMVTPFRPRARVLPPPSGAVLARLRDLTDAGGAASAHGETVTLTPRDGAERIVAALREWGELD